ncbi:hypothetical protein F5B21DRAFT_521410 [Xylaria acuta]|nr:hypothetical protein F5B21DRAFT_521410 [Xylaria acuta]
MAARDRLDTLSRPQLDKYLEECTAALSTALEDIKIAIGGAAKNRHQIYQCFLTLEHKWRRRLSCRAAAARRDPAASTLALESLLFPLYVADELADRDFYRLVACLPIRPRAYATPRNMRRSTRTAAVDAAVTPPGTPPKLAVKPLQQCAEIWGFQSHLALYFILGTSVCSKYYALERIIEAKEYSPGLEWKSFYSHIARCSYERRGIPLHPLSEVPAMSAYTDEVQTEDVTNAIKELCPGLVNKKNEGQIEYSDGDESSDDGHGLLDTPADTPRYADKKRSADRPLQPNTDKKMRHEILSTTPERPNECSRLRVRKAIEVSSNDGTETGRDNDAGLVLASMDGRLVDRVINAAFDLVSSLRHDTFYLDPLPVRNHARLYKKLLAHRLTRSTRVLAPIHLLENDHWVLCVLVPRFDGAANSSSGASVMVHLYDSLPHKNNTDQVIEVLRRAAQAVIRDEVDAKAGESTAAALFACLRRPRDIIIDAIKCSRQVNGIDCGIAAIVNSLISLSAAHVGLGDGEKTVYQFEAHNFTLWRAVLLTLIQADILDTQVNEIYYPESVSRLLCTVGTIGKNIVPHTQSIPVPLSSSGITLAQKRIALEASITSYTDQLNNVLEEHDLCTSTIADFRAIIDVLKNVRDGANFELLAGDVDGISTAVTQLGNLPNMLVQSQVLVHLTGVVSSTRRQLDRGRRAYRVLRELTAKLEEDVIRISDWVGKVETEQQNGLGT